MKTDSEQKNAPAKERTKYGTTPPYISFEEAIKTIKEVSNASGFDGSIDVLAKVLINSPSSSSFQKKVAALRGFGLLSISGGQYSITEIGRHIAHPTDPDEEKSGIFDAFCSQGFLKTTWENYKGKILPQPKYLASFFADKLEAPANMKDLWPTYFIEAAKFAGLLHERETGSYQVLLGPSTEKKTETKQITDDKTNAEKKPHGQADGDGSNSVTSGLGISNTVSWGILSQRRLSGNRKAVIAIPDELSQEDIDMLKVILKGIDAQLDGLKKYDVQ